MSSFLSNIKNLFFPTEKKNILILGYKTAGKSTIIDQLIQRKILINRREETHGSRTREIEIKIGDVTHEFNITDIGGSKQYQDMFWKVALAKANGIIYVIDSSLLYSCEGGEFIDDETQCPNPTIGIMKCSCKSNAIFRESRLAKSFAFSILDTGKPILVFLNKIDLADTQKINSKEEMKNIYALSEDGKYNVKVSLGSALTGENVFESISWLFEEMN